MISQTLCILGRQPALGRAELESLYGAEQIRKVGQVAVTVDAVPDNISFSRLGGTMKLCKILTSLPTTRWQDIEDYLAKTIPEHASYLPEGKMQLGLSVYGLSVNSRQLQATGLTLKKVIRTTGRSVRLIPNQKPELNSAQVLHNHLTGPLGWELVILRDGNNTLLAQTINVQDITAYANRDQARPKRDARVGMLPPKLAQIIVNLAVGKDELVSAGISSWKDFNNESNKNLHRAEISDPFCGTGVILQEALLMGYNIHGSDIDPRMIEYTRANLDWLFNTKGSWELDVWDATKFLCIGNFIACETYLGRPFSALPKPEVLQAVMQDVDTIHKKFLQKIAQISKTGYRCCLAVPAWKTPNGFRHLPVLDHLADLGYTRMSFVHASNQELIYHRPNQIVARELVVLVRK